MTGATIDTIESFRTRWRRWLGNKTRQDREYWVTLLDSNWMAWPYKILDREPLSLMDVSREKVKSIWLQAINKADMVQLRKLDGLYASEKAGLL